MEKARTDIDNQRKVEAWKWSRVILFSVFGWSTLGIGMASQVVVARPLLDGVQVEWSQAVFESLFFTSYWGVMSFAVFRMVKRFPLGRRNLIPNIFRHILFALAIALLYIVVCVSIPGVDHHIAAKPTTFFEKFRTFGTLVYPSQILFYSLVMMGCHAIQLYGRLKNNEVIASQLQTELVSANLKGLKSQLNPHFLFNTLSAITTFIHEDPDLAEKMTVRLSQLLRMSLDSSDKQLRSLEEELEFLEKYVEIQTMRFGSRVSYQEQIDPNCRPLFVPTLILQPLVENAFKHGVGRSTRKCTVQLSARLIGEQLLLTVSDDGPGETELGSDGVGLKNTRSRLKHLFGDDFMVTINRSRGFKVELSIPVAKDSS